jgi:uncharacterized protein YjbJ (UPF0337 family)
MNKDSFKGMWKEFKGKVKQQWGKLTDDDITQIDGKREELLGRLQKYYGYTKEKAENELSTWEKKFNRDQPLEDLDEDLEEHKVPTQKNKRF